MASINRDEFLGKIQPLIPHTEYVPQKWSVLSFGGKDFADAAGDFGESFIEEFAPIGAAKVLAGKDIFSQVQHTGEKLPAQEGFDGALSPLVKGMSIENRLMVINSKSETELAQKVSVINQYNQDASERMQGSMGMLGAIAGGIASPGGIAGLMARTAKGVASATAITAFEEAALHQTDPNRSELGSVGAVAGSALFDTSLLAAKSFFKVRRYALDPIEEEAITREVAQAITLNHGFHEVEPQLSDIFKQMDEAEAAGDYGSFF